MVSIINTDILSPGHKYGGTNHSDMFRPGVGERESRCSVDLGRQARAQSTTIAFVLLLAITLGGVTMILAFGAQSLGDLEGQASSEQAEHAFTKLDSTGAEVALGQSEARTVELGSRGRSGGSVRTVRTGEMTLAYQGGSTIHNETLGAVVYESEGHTVAYQGGGVWRGTGTESQMISPPEIHYTDGTLTIPMIVVRPGGPGSSDRLVIRRLSQQIGLGPGTVEDEVVTLSIRSDYYVGWAQFFESRLDEVHVDVDHANRTTTVELGRITFDVRYDSAVYAEDGDVVVSTGNSEINGPVTAEGQVSTGAASSVNGNVEENVQSSYDPLDPVIDQKLSDAPGNPDVTQQQLDGGGTVSGPATVYDPDDVQLNGDTLTVDLSGGNVTLLVDGNVSIENGADLHVVNPGNNSLRVFTSGDVTVKNGRAFVGTTGSVDAKHLLVFGRSDTQVGLAGGSTYVEAAVFAPRHEEVSGYNTAFPTAQSQCNLGGYWADTCIATGNSALDGAVVAGPAAVKQSTEVNYDPALGGLDLSVNADDLLPPPLTYLHLSVNEIAVEGGSSVGPTFTSTPTPGPTPTPTSTPTPTPANHPAVTIDSVTITESTHAGNTQYDVTVDWSASDPDADLDSVQVAIEDVVGGCGTTGDTTTASGGSASGSLSRTFGTYTGPPGGRCTSGDEYAVTVTVEDEAGHTDTATRTAEA